MNAVMNGAKSLQRNTANGKSSFTFGQKGGDKMIDSSNQNGNFTKEEHDDLIMEQNEQK